MQDFLPLLNKQCVWIMKRIIYILIWIGQFYFFLYSTRDLSEWNSIGMLALNTVGFRFLLILRTNCKAENLCEIGRVSKCRNAVDAVINFGTLLPPKIILHSVYHAFVSQLYFSCGFYSCDSIWVKRVLFLFIAGICKTILVGIPSVFFHVFLHGYCSCCCCCCLILLFYNFLSVSLRPSLS